MNFHQDYELLSANMMRMSVELSSLLGNKGAEEVPRDPHYWGAQYNHETGNMAASVGDGGDGGRMFGEFIAAPAFAHQSAVQQAHSDNPGFVTRNAANPPIPHAQPKGCVAQNCRLGAKSRDKKAPTSKGTTAKELLQNKCINRNTVFRVFREFFNIHHTLESCMSATLACSVRNEVPLRADSVCLEPGNWNVQYHVRQVMRKCTMALREMQRRCSDLKVHNGRMYAECDRQLKTLTKLLAELNVYRNVVLEHRYMRFVTEEAKGLAVRLALLLLQINGHLMKCHKLLEELERYVSSGQAAKTNFHMAAAPTIFENGGLRDMYTQPNAMTAEQQDDEDSDERQPMRFIG